MPILGKENTQHHILCYYHLWGFGEKLPHGLMGLNTWSSTGLGTHCVGKSWNSGTGALLEEGRHWGGVGVGCSFHLFPLTQCLHSWFSTCRGKVICQPCSDTPPMLSWPHGLPLWNCKPNRLLLRAIVFYHGNRNKTEYYHINECKHLTFWIFILKKLNIWRL